MSSMVWITFFLTLLSGTIAALIGVWIQQWYSKKTTRKRLISALKFELRANLVRINDNLESVQNNNVLTDPLETRIYEEIASKYPDLFQELPKNGSEIEEIITKLYGITKFINLLQYAIISDFGKLPDNNKESMVRVLTKLSGLIKRAINMVDGVFQE